MKKSIIASLTIGTLALTAGTAPVFHASFDKDLNGSGANASIVKGVSYSKKTAPVLVGGVSGKALTVGTSADKKDLYNALYPADKILNPAQGTVSFWCKSENWDTSDKDYHLFFRARGKDADFILYKVPNPMFSFIIGPARMVNGKKIWTEIRGKVTTWKRGEWHFIAASWGNGKVILYIDGKAVNSKAITNLPGSFDRFGAGGLYPAAWRNQGKSAIDELKIFDRPLSPAEISAEYTSGAKLLKK